MFFEKMLGVHGNIGVQRDSKTLYKMSFSIFCAIACEFGVKVLKKSASMT
jgi:hypothetical protein